MRSLPELSPVTIPPALPPSTDELKQLIGKVTAATAAMIGRGVLDWRNIGRMQPDTKQNVGATMVVQFYAHVVTPPTR